MTGKPAALEDELRPDWLPIQYLDKLHHAHTSSIESVKRYERLKRQQELKAQGDESVTESGGNNEDEHGVEIEEIHQSTTYTGVQTDLTRSHILLFQQELIEANERIRKLEGLLKGTTQQKPHFLMTSLSSFTLVFPTL